MKNSLLFFLLLLISVQWAADRRLPAQGSARDYQLARTYAERTKNLVFRDSVRPHWFGRDRDRFWYRVDTGQQAHEFVIVDASKGIRQPAFNHKTLADQLSKHSGVTAESRRLDLSSLSFSEDLSRVRFRLADRHWQYNCPDGPLESADENGAVATDREGLTPLATVIRSGDSVDRVPIRFDNRLDQRLHVKWVEPSGGRRPYGTVAGGKTFELSTFDGHAWVLETDAGDTVAAFVAEASSNDAVIDAATRKPKTFAGNNHKRQRGGNRSPDGQWQVIIQDHNVELVETGSGHRQAVTQDGIKNDGYGGPVWWSPDSQSFVVMKTARADERKIHMVDASPDDSIHSNLVTVPYAKPGDPIDHPRPVLFHVADPQPLLVDDQSFSNPYAINDLAWHDDGSSFSFVYNQRGHQLLRLIAVDAKSAQPRVVVDETSDTFVCYSHKKYVRRIDATNELIWMSERSGWNHLYLIDQSSGKVKNAITTGDWCVREVVRVDEQRRQVWLAVSGMDADQDPYHLHLIRVDFDGKNLTRLTRRDGNHRWSFSPDDQFLIDTYSRVDLPPVTELRDAISGDLICVLETADSSQLMETGWRPPQRFVAKGRDQATDIHGIIIRPTSFDPKKRYPILEAIYAGPHSAFVPKTFSRHVGLYEMAELGFIVVKIDGMGTSYRSKAFHDVCWKNLGDSGFPDRIAWIKAAASEHPEMDLSRVGIWGGSAGGQSAMRALIAHGDFYHAAVADCGCHDNRVDKRWWNEQWMGWPIGEHYSEQSNVTQAHRLQGDLLLIWGELDRNVDPASSMQVVDALVRADKDFELLIMPGVGHGAAGHPYAKRRQADFFVRKLGDRKAVSD